MTSGPDFSSTLLQLKKAVPQTLPFPEMVTCYFIIFLPSARQKAMRLGWADSMVLEPGGHKSHMAMNGIKYSLIRKFGLLNDTWSQ